ncbi:fumarylacetoacetate hydrolase family protein [Asanoa sp. NPDC050611]|uniref:fumarylacetoacetate hydrolase family protein n=1 Tax=Asanoa sp. NPDC050611 TaxID=3157098 RepID=UPI0033E6984F
MNGATAVDVEKASEGRFGPDPQTVYADWDAFCAWARQAGEPDGHAVDPARLGPPAPEPRQVFAIGLNYREHAAESGHEVPTEPTVFTKFPASFTGPYGQIELPGDGRTDWEVELVAVIGRRAERVPRADAWHHVAGLTIGQDLSERVRQSRGPAPQFSLAKSFTGFSPTGPWLVTPDEFADPDDIELGCVLNGEHVQRARTRDLVFDVPEIISRLSHVLPLLPGDVIFTGTPAGVGFGRNPQRFLAPGDELVSYVTGIGEMKHSFMAAPAAG